MRRKNHSHQQDIEDLKKQNNILEQQSKSSLICTTSYYSVCLMEEISGSLVVKVITYHTDNLSSIPEMGVMCEAPKDAGSNRFQVCGLARAD